MKISTTQFIVSFGSASAFVTPVAKLRCLPLRMSNPNEGKGFGQVSMEVENLAPMKNIPVAPKKSQSLPFVNCPAALDGSMAGDVGFDPLGFAGTTTDLKNYRDAEIKHGRLAMLAAAGWPLSELFDKKIAAALGLPAVLDANNRVPSVLNGGMGKISPVYWGACLLLASAIEVYESGVASKKKDYFPGDLGFDPFGLYPKEEKDRKWMQTAEIKNGRLAMIAITAFAAQEFVTHIAIIDETPFFFKPIWQVLADNANAGYSYPEETPAILEAVTAPLDAAATTSAEAATAIIPSVDVVPAAPVEAAAVTPPVGVVSTDSVEAASAVSRPVNDEELVEARKRIAELEAKLSAISSLTQ